MCCSRTDIDELGGGIESRASCGAALAFDSSNLALVEGVVLVLLEGTLYTSNDSSNFRIDGQ